MDPRHGARGTGLLFIASVLGMIALLIAGLGIASWFTTGQLVLSGFGSFAGPGTEIGLAKIEVCFGGPCVSAWTYELADGAFGTLATMALLLGVAFGALVLWFANRRIAGTDVPILSKLLAYALGGAAVVASLLCMFVHPPETIAYEIVPGIASIELDAMRMVAITTDPELGLGGYVTLAGLLLGGFVVWGARAAVQPIENRRPRRQRREERPDTARGPDADPFRSPPAPQLALVRHERPIETPVVDNPEQQPPKLLR